jgi:hypothetical protein
VNSRIQKRRRKGINSHDARSCGYDCAHCTDLQCRGSDAAVKFIAELDARKDDGFRPPLPVNKYKQFHGYSWRGRFANREKKQNALLVEFMRERLWEHKENSELPALITSAGSEGWAWPAPWETSRKVPVPTECPMCGKTQQNCVCGARNLFEGKD